MKKNILFLETGNVIGKVGIGGSFRSLLQIVEGLNKSKYKLVILLYHNFDIIGEYERNNCKVIVVKFDNNKSLSQKSPTDKIRNYATRPLKKYYWFRKMSRNLSIIKRCGKIKYILKIINEENIDIVHCNDRISTNMEGIIASFLANKPCICHQRQFNYNLSLIEHFFAQRISKYIAISTATKNNLLSIGIDPEKIEIIHNWINVKKNNTFVQKKIEKDDGFKILWLGRIVYWKGLHLLINIAEKLKKHLENFSIDVVGAPPSNSDLIYFNNLKKAVQSYQLNAIINFSGYKNYEEIFKIKYDLLIHTSIRPEPFGRVIIEAMFNRIPVIASRIGGVLDIIDEGINGLLFEPQDTNQLLQKIILVYNNKKLREKLIENAYMRVIKKFSERSKGIDKFEKIYDYII